MQLKVISNVVLQPPNPLSQLQNEIPREIENKLPSDLELSQNEIEALIKEALVSLAQLANLSNLSLDKIVNEILNSHGV